MKRVLRTALALAAVVVFSRATCGRAKPANVTPVQRMTIVDHVYFHNMGIAFDGEHYFTINGGNDGSSLVNEYDRTGALVESYDFGIDGRSIGYCESDGMLYAKPYGEDLLSLDTDTETSDTEHEGLFSGDQSSVAFAPDGSTVYELDDGTVLVYDLDEGEEVSSFDLDTYSSNEEGGDAYAIAASDRFLFVWNDDRDICVYDRDGRYITTFELPRSGLGFSLSYCNGMLWVAADADGSDAGADGKWYGYELRGLE